MYGGAESPMLRAIVSISVRALSHAAAGRAAAALPVKSLIALFVLPANFAYMSRALTPRISSCGG